MVPETAQVRCQYHPKGYGHVDAASEWRESINSVNGEFAESTGEHKHRAHGKEGSLREGKTQRFGILAAGASVQEYQLWLRRQKFVIMKEYAGHNLNLCISFGVMDCRFCAIRVHPISWMNTVPLMCFLWEMGCFSLAIKHKETQIFDIAEFFTHHC